MSSTPAHVAFFVFVLIGIGSNLPWNVFITAQGYFKQRLINTVYEETFLNWFSIGYNLTTLVTMLIRTVCIGDRIPSAVKTVFASLVVIMTVIFGHCQLTQVPEYTGAPFFNVTMASIVLVAAASTLMQDGTLRIVAKFPSKYTQAVMIGQSIAGFAVAVSNFIILLAEKEEDALFMLDRLAADANLEAFTYFLMVFLTLVVCTLSFIFMIRMPLFKHYNEPNPDDKYIDDERIAMDDEDGAAEKLLSGEETDITMVDSPQTSDPEPDFVVIMYKARYYAATLFLVFLVTMGLFPAITSAIKSVNPGRGKFFRDYFTPSSLVLLNFGDFIGRMVASMLPRITSKQQFATGLARLLFIPLMMLCNVQNEHGQVITHVVFRNDLFPFFFLLAMAISNGLLCTVALMDYPRKLHTAAEKDLGGTVMFFVLCSGLSSGSLASFALRAMLG